MPNNLPYFKDKPNPPHPIIKYRELTKTEEAFIKNRNPEIAKMLIEIIKSDNK